MQKKTWRLVFLSLGVFFLIFTGYSLTLAVIFSQSVKSFKRGEFEKAGKKAKLGLYLVEPVDKLSFGKSKNLKIAKTTFGLTYTASKIAPVVVKQTDLTNLDLKQIISQVPQLVDQAANNKLKLNKVSGLKNSKYMEEVIQVIDFIKNYQTEIKNIAQDLSQTTQTWLVVFQNSNELRATGGFMGSYALVTFDRGKLKEINIEDIYDADGQFKGFVPPPSGVKRYLSADKGLRLPDANWSVDLPTAVNQVLTYFALGNRPKITGAIMINNNLVKKLLELTGPLYIADYQKNITADNFDQALQERGEFFPGSQKKKHLLTLVFDQLMLKIPQITKENPKKLLTLLTLAVKEKDIQAYSLDSNWNKLLTGLGLTTGLVDHPECLDLALVESNVGINKVNNYIIRDVNINYDTKPQSQMSIVLNFINQAPTNQEGKDEYVNYQRVIVEPNWQVKKIMVNNKPVNQIDDELVTTGSGDQFRQIGFLTITKPQTKTQAQIELIDPTLTSVKKLCLFKQPGLPATDYTITANLEGQSQTQVVTLDQDKEIKLIN